MAVTLYFKDGTSTSLDSGAAIVPYSSEPAMDAVVDAGPTVHIVFVRDNLEYAVIS